MSRVADPKARVALLRAAEQVFAERGLDGAKVEDIARRAGVSKGAFYLHFESKEAALERIVESFLAHCGSYFAPPWRYPDLPEEPLELLDFTVERDVQIYEFLWQNRAVLRILGSCHGAHGHLVRAFENEIAQRNREWLQHWKHVGLIRDGVDIDLATTIICGAYGELSRRMQRDGVRPPLEAWVSFAQETFARAFGTVELIAAVEKRSRRASFEGRPSRGRARLARKD
jgi:AcrR family transcriptional regulator